jgi:hypothetical protein
MQTNENAARPEFIDRPLTKTERDFNDFHSQNPHVYTALEDLAVRASNAGVKRLGVGALVETLRYSASLQTQGDAYKINNNYRALYARLLILKRPELASLLETRVRRSVLQYKDV